MQKIIGKTVSFAIDKLLTKEIKLIILKEIGDIIVKKMPGKIDDKIWNQIKKGL